MSIPQARLAGLIPSQQTEPPLPDCPCRICVDKRALLARERLTPSQRTNPLYGQHNAYRQGDEYFCPRCRKRWPVSEDAPQECS